MQLYQGPSFQTVFAVTLAPLAVPAALDGADSNAMVGLANGSHQKLKRW